MEAGTDWTPSIRQWLAATDELDLIHSALVLTDLLAELDPDWSDATAVRARLLLEQGQPAPAAELLGHGFDAAAPLSELTLLKACAAACLGNEPAYRYLQSVLRADSDQGRPRWIVMATTALAAEHRSDHEIADALWAALLRDGVLTALTLPRGIAARVAGRQGRTGRRRELFRSMAKEFDRLDLSLAADPEPALLAARLLIQRNDRAGAAILLFALARRFEPQVHPAIVRALESMGLRLSGRMRPGIQVPLSMDRTDRRTKRSIALRDIPRGPYNRQAAMAFFGLLAVFPAMMIATLWMVDEQHRPLTIALVWAGLLGGLPAFAAGLIGLLTWLFPSLAERRPPKRVRIVPACECLTNRGMRGDAAADYAELHLQPRPAPTLPPVSPGSPPMTVAGCPYTGIAWLVVRDREARPVLVLRGTAPESADDAHRSVPPQPQTGMYL